MVTITLSNPHRSIANLRIENFGYALTDANKAIENDKASCCVMGFCYSYPVIL